MPEFNAEERDGRNVAFPLKSEEEIYIGELAVLMPPALPLPQKPQQD